MTLPWINVTANLLDGISLLNSLTEECFTKLLSQDMRNENTSIEDYVEQLKPDSNMNHNEIILVIQTMRYILKQVSKIILKPTALQRDLTEIMKLDNGKAEEFVKIWTGDTITAFNLDNRMKLEQVSWDLNLGIASHVCNEEIVPHARMQLQLANVESSEKEELILNLDEEELLSFYKTIESIQVKLDTIQSS